MKKYLRSDSDVFFEQEPRKNILIRKLNNAEVWKNLCFSNIFQLIPIWVMSFIQMVSVYKFEIRDYTNNLLVFVIVSCAANLSDIFGGKNLKMEKTATIFVIFVLISVLCFTSTFYCLMLLCSVSSGLLIKENIMLSISLIFTLVVILISVLKTAGKEK